MVKTVRELTDKVTAEEKQQLKQLEQTIDKTLTDRFLPGSGNDVCINVPNWYAPRSRVHEKIVQMYGAAGWFVEWESDQRDGNYLRFKPITRRDD